MIRPTPKWYKATGAAKSAVPAPQKAQPRSALTKVGARTYGKPEINEIVGHFERVFGYPLSGPGRQRKAAQKILTACRQDVATAKRAIDVAYAAACDQYSRVKVADLEEMVKQWNGLKAYAVTKPRQVSRVGHVGGKR